MTTAARHARAKIRKAIADHLATPIATVFPTSAKERVYPSRIMPIKDEELPVILIYARNEPVDPESYPKSGHNGSTERDLRLAVECVAEATEDLDDVLDDLAFEVEAALEWFEIPGFETATIRLSESEIEVNDEGRKPIGAVRLTYSVAYRNPYRVGENPNEPPPARTAPPSDVYSGPRVGGAATAHEEVTP